MRLLILLSIMTMSTPSFAGDVDERINAINAKTEKCLKNVSAPNVQIDCYLAKERQAKFLLDEVFKNQVELIRENFEDSDDLNDVTESFVKLLESEFSWGEYVENQCELLGFVRRVNQSGNQALITSICKGNKMIERIKELDQLIVR